MKKSNSFKKPITNENNNPNQQKTLLQFWKSNPQQQQQQISKQTPTVSNQNLNKFNSSSLIKSNQNGKACNEKPSEDIILDNEDEDADDLLISRYLLNSTNNKENATSMSYTDEANNFSANATNVNESNMDALTIGINDNELVSTQYTDTIGFDFNSGNVWIYPNNRPIRSYQYNIIERCLYKNTMVVLPTGMGKTFVAAVVMFNFYRWYPSGKIIFMAPTKPLVNQQADACYEVVGISKDDMVQMTGQIAPEKRKVLWDTKRVFFLTPQVISNDILRNNVQVEQIKCVVIDEAHKGTGEYAFCKVIQSINELNKNFRIIALTATPGSDIKTIQNLIDNLLISHIELRSDESIDIQQYNHGRDTKQFVVPLSGEILNIRNSFANVMKGPLKRLEMNKLFLGKDPLLLNRVQILTRREMFRKNPSGLNPKQTSFVESDLALLVTFVHGLELLTLYGVKSFYVYLKGYIENTDGSKSVSQQSKVKTEIFNNAEMGKIYNNLQETFENKDSVIPRTWRHPKLLKLEEVILHHFETFDKKDTRVMIFSQYRESVYEIKEMLSSHSIIKAIEFVGQSSTSDKKKTVTQKEQLEVVKKFRDGGFNTLVSTCVGEEGLDIGEVDLIICYDSQNSPIRLIQRMGRTGRKREGKVVILLTEGKEESSYKASLSKKKSIYKIIENGKKNFQFYKNNPLMIPKGVKLQCQKIFIKIPDEPTETVKTKAEGKKLTEKKPKVKTEKKAKKLIVDLETNSKNTFDCSELPDLDFLENSNSNSNSTLMITSNNTKKTDITSVLAPEPVPSPPKSKAKEPQPPKKFDINNFFNLTKPTLPSTSGKLVPDLPKNFKKLCKTFGKKNSITKEALSGFKLNDYLNLWDPDDDDFKLVQTDLKDREALNDVYKRQNKNELLEKFSDFYSQLLEDLAINKCEVEANESSRVFKTIEKNNKNPEMKPNNKTYDYNCDEIIDNTCSFNANQDNFKDGKQKSPLNSIKNELPKPTFSLQNQTKQNEVSIINDTVYVDNKFQSSSILQNQSSVKNIDESQATSIKIDTLKPVSRFISLNKNTSTPLRIETKTPYKNQKESQPSPLLIDSPLVISQRNTINGHLKNDESMVGMTQALQLLNQTNMVSQEIPKIVVTKPQQMVDKAEVKFNNYHIVFDTKSNLNDLFGQDETDEEEEDDIIISNVAKKFESSIQVNNTYMRAKTDLDELFGKDDDDDDAISYSPKIPLTNFVIPSNKIVKTNQNFENDSVVICSEEKPNTKPNKMNDIPTLSELNELFNDDSEEDVILEQNDIIQINEPNKSVKNLAPTEIQNKTSQESDETLFFVKKKSKKVINELSSFLSDYENLPKNKSINNSMDDDFDKVIGNNSNNDEEEEDAIFVEEVLKPKKNAKQKKGLAEFVNDEAEISDEDDFSDESGDENENSYDLKDSLIDNNHYTQNESMYLQYLRADKVLPPKPSYLNRPMKPITDDIFSQMPCQDSSYQLDSFVVSDDYLTQRKPKKKSKKKDKQKELEFEKAKEEIKDKKNKKLRRIKMLQDDDEDSKSSSCILVDADEPLIKNPRVSNYENRTTNNANELNELNELFMSSDDSDDFKVVSVIAENRQPVLADTNKQNQIKSAKIEIVNDDDDIKILDKKVFDVFKKPSIANNTTNSTLNCKNENKSSLNQNLKSETTLATNQSTIIKEETKKNSNWIIFDNSLLASGQNLIQSLRKTWIPDKILSQTNIRTDIVVSQRLAVVLYKWTELSVGVYRDQIVEKFATAYEYYPQVVVIIQDDREANSSKGRTLIFDTIFNYLTKVSRVMVSKFKTDETSNCLNSLSKSEASNGYAINVDCHRLFEKRKNEIAFYLSLPGVSIVNAIYFVENFSCISKGFLDTVRVWIQITKPLSENFGFFRCDCMVVKGFQIIIWSFLINRYIQTNRLCNSSLEDLKSKGKLSDKKAKKLLKLLID